MTICLDASVVGKLICPDEQADPIIERYQEVRVGGRSFIAPQLLPFEVTSILRKKQVRKLLSPVEVLAAIRSFHDLKIQLVVFPGLPERSLALCNSIEGRLTPYDASYLAVAEHLNASLWTADRDFHRLVSPVFPEVELV